MITKKKILGWVGTPSIHYNNSSMKGNTRLYYTIERSNFIISHHLLKCNYFFSAGGVWLSAFLMNSLASSLRGCPACIKTA